MTYPTQPTASHFIDGAYVEDTTGTPIPVIYPATGEEIATVYAATPDIVDRALASAQKAQKEWAALSGTERGRVLRRAADIMRERNHDLSALETRDTGRDLTVAGAVGGIGHGLEMFLGLFDHAGDAVGLEGVQVLVAFVRHGIEAEGEEVQPRAEHGEDRGLDHAEAREACHGKPRAREQAAEDLAREGRAARDFARVIGLVGQHALAREPCGQQHQRQRAEPEGHLRWRACEGLPDHRQRREEEEVDPPARARAPRAAKIGPRKIGFAARLAIGAVFAAIALRHHAPPVSET